MVVQTLAKEPFRELDQRKLFRGRGNRENVYFFLDFSNIAINAMQLAPSLGDGIFASRSVRLSGTNLRHFVERNRQWRRGYGAAGLADQNSPIKRHFEQAGIQFDICERGQISGKEQNVDQRIQLEMYRLLAPGIEKGTVVLATGDGNGISENQGFIEVLSTLQNYGFRIEVLSWRHSFSSDLKKWATTNGRVIELDDFYNELTFVEGRRMPTPINQLSKKMIRSGLI